MTTDLATLIEKAFDYRGDVTLRLKNGSEVVGFLCNREAKGIKRCPEPFVEVMMEGSSDKRLIKYSEIETVALSGEDMAAGKSWEEWMAKQEKKHPVAK
jgi:hypothetical protein